MQAAFKALGARFVALDGNDYAGEDHWRKADGTAVEYFNWNSGQPDNVRGKESYISTYDNDQWNAFPYDHLVDIICQENKPECQAKHHLKPTCDLGVTISTGQGDSTLGFTFNSFKWSTTKVGNNGVAENQDLSCSIALAKTPAAVAPQTCA